MRAWSCMNVRVESQVRILPAVDAFKRPVPWLLRVVMCVERPMQPLHVPTRTWLACSSANSNRKLQALPNITKVELREPAWYECVSRNNITAVLRPIGHVLSPHVPSPHLAQHLGLLSDPCPAPRACRGLRVCAPASTLICCRRTVM